MEGWIWIVCEGGPYDGNSYRLKVVFDGRAFRFGDPGRPEVWYRLSGRYRETRGGVIAVASPVDERDPVDEVAPRSAGSPQLTS